MACIASCFTISRSRTAQSRQHVMPMCDSPMAAACGGVGATSRAAQRSAKALVRDDRLPCVPALDRACVRSQRQTVTLRDDGWEWAARTSTFIRSGNRTSALLKRCLLGLRHTHATRWWWSCLRGGEETNHDDSRRWSLRLAGLRSWCVFVSEGVAYQEKGRSGRHELLAHRSRLRHTS